MNGLLFAPILNASTRGAFGALQKIFGVQFTAVLSFQLRSTAAPIHSTIHPRVLPYAAFGDYEVPAITQAKLIETSVFWWSRAFPSSSNAYIAVPTLAEAILKAKIFILTKYKPATHNPVAAQSTKSDPSLFVLLRCCPHSIVHSSCLAHVQRCRSFSLLFLVNFLQHLRCLSSA